jgi:probable phosphoglycerate mutase
MSPGGETLDEFLDRIRGVVATIVDEFDRRTVLIVCHGGIIMGASELFIETERGGAGGRFLNPMNTAITEWRRRFRGDEPETDWFIARYNDHAHLIG